MSKLLLLAVMLAVPKCDEQPTVRHGSVAEYANPQANMDCWQDTICNLPCVVCRSGNGIAMSCDHSKGKLRCGVVLPGVPNGKN